MICIHSFRSVSFQILPTIGVGVNERAAYIYRPNAYMTTESKGIEVIFVLVQLLGILNPILYVCRRDEYISRELLLCYVIYLFLFHQIKDIVRTMSKHIILIVNDLKLHFLLI